MGFSDAVEWWEEWQLRILVLTSLFIQYVLLLTANLRKIYVSHWFKFFTWLAYLASDDMAIYALATLFNRHRKQEWVSTHRNSVSLEALWAPILLLHLGGQDFITAYSIEDNELWSRHLLTAVTQITVAIYVFHKSWSGDKRLLQAAIVIFVPGVLKCMEKPLALKSASINSIAGISGSMEKADEDINSLEDYIEAASAHVRGKRAFRSGGEACEEEPYLLFVDRPYPYSVRLMNLRSIMGAGAHRLVQSGLSRAFDRLYTKEEMSNGLDIFSRRKLTIKNRIGFYIRAAASYLTITAIGLFHKSNREAYNQTDVKVTYILICCTAALEYLSSYIRHCSSLKLRDLIYMRMGLRTEGIKPWPEQVAQYNLIGHLASSKRKWFRKLLFIGRDYIDQLFCMKPCKSSESITELVHDHIMDGWQNCITDTDSYRNFNSNRGQRTLKRGKWEGSLVQSLQRPFDESVIIWHLATDFCFYQLNTSKSPSPSHEDASWCRVMSNYMAYLLFANPDMLIPGARRSLFKDAYDEIEKMVTDKPSADGTESSKSKKTPAPSEEELARKIMEKGTNDSVLVRDAWLLAQELIRLAKQEEEEEEEEEKGQQKMWRVIRGVWVEMLCFSAGRCRGYLHAKSLGKGGEYLSYVWLLLSYMGMETMAEKMQRMELDAQGDMGAAGPTSTPLQSTTGDNSA